jgi:hypothetical protein
MERDWVRVVAEETCDECGLNAGGVDRASLPDLLRAEAAAWSSFLRSAPAPSLRGRRDEAWSPLEHACHARDTLAIFAGRVDRVLAEDEPELGWWDHEAAAVDERYDEQDPLEVAGAVVANAGVLATGLERVEGDGWARAGVRRAGERFTVEGLGRFALHEARHHRVAAEAAS